MARNLLFVTNGDKEYEQGFSYVYKLSKALKTRIFILMIFEKSLIKRFEDNMAAVAFAEAGETEIAKEISAEWLRKIEIKTVSRIDSLIEKYYEYEAPIKIRCKAGVGDIGSNIKKIVENEPGIEMVLLSPSLSDKGIINVKKLLRNISRPIVKISKLSKANT